MVPAGCDLGALPALPLAPRWHLRQLTEAPVPPSATDCFIPCLKTYYTGSQLVIHVSIFCSVEGEPRASHIVLKWITTQPHSRLSLMFVFSSVFHFT